MYVRCIQPNLSLLQCYFWTAIGNCTGRHNLKLFMNAWMEQLSVYMCSEFQSLQQLLQGVQVSPTKLTMPSIIRHKNTLIFSIHTG